ncbi:30S ribosomal protein S20 family protein [Aneurinibacillus aneurinilyticus ATCC 12856]|uniref:30S ribosomal protein S20 family protein n=2 Tax=Aneurinibacillus aneurinilyticus TaxID=1391 RepID=U1YF57_ANEAE|nr:30S ribosomal protein S20 family protein [Aneurinibacillus aneurinilyticus ATCC 12856]
MKGGEGMEANHNEGKKAYRKSERKTALTSALHRYKQHLRELEADTLNVKTEAGRKALTNKIWRIIDKIRVVEAKLKSK